MGVLIRWFLVGRWVFKAYVRSIGLSDRVMIFRLYENMRMCNVCGCAKSNAVASDIRGILHLKPSDYSLGRGQ